MTYKLKLRIYVLNVGLGCVELDILWGGGGRFIGNPLTHLKTGLTPTLSLLLKQQPIGLFTLYGGL